MRPRLLTSAFALVFAANFLHSLTFFLFVHLPGFLEAKGADAFQIGVVMAAMPATAILVRPIVGRAMDTRGRRLVLRVGWVLSVAGSVLYLSIDRLDAWVLFVRAVHGVSEGMLFSVLFTIAADISPPSRRTEGIALFGISGILPFAVAGLAGDAILAAGTYHDLFWLAAAVSFAGLLASWPLQDGSSRLEPAGRPRSVLATLAQSELRPLWLVGFAFALAIASYFAFLKPFVLHTGVGSVGLFFTSYTLAAILLRLGFAWVPDRLGPKRVLPPALACTSAALVLLAQYSGPLEMVASGILAGLGHGFVFPIVSGLVVVRASPRERGAAMALFTGLFDAGMLVGGPCLGLVARAHGYPTMFVTAAALLVLGTTLGLVVDRRRA